MVYKGEIINLDEAVVMAIVNVTADSFFDGGSYLEEKSFIERVNSQLTQGASIIDLGGCSSRPGAERASIQEELSRVTWATKILKREFPNVILSLDTYRSEVAKAVTDIWGETIINDISAGEADKNMIDFISSAQCPYIAMHYKKESEDDDITDSVMNFFYTKRELFERKAIKDVIFDVGFGFGKSLDENYQLVCDFENFKILERPLLVGVSRKSMIYKTLNTTPAEALTGTIALNSILIEKGANILRVHDSQQAYDTIKIVNKLL